MRAPLAALALVLVLAGCLDPTPEPGATWSVTEPVTLSKAASGPGDVSVVFVTGRFEPANGTLMKCDRGFSYDVDARNRTLTQDGSYAGLGNASAIVAMDVDIGSCPLAYGLSGQSPVLVRVAVQDLAGVAPTDPAKDVMLEVAVREDGVVLGAGADLLATLHWGESTQVTYDGPEGTATVTVTAARGWTVVTDLQLAPV